MYTFIVYITIFIKFSLNCYLYTPFTIGKGEPIRCVLMPTFSSLLIMKSKSTKSKQFLVISSSDTEDRRRTGLRN